MLGIDRSTEYELAGLLCLAAGWLIPYGGFLLLVGVYFLWTGHRVYKRDEAQA